jgi:two-component system chemotaxis response regulator CheB
MLNPCIEKPIRVIIADDSAFVRKAMVLLLEEDPEVKVVGIAANGKECIELVESLHPDVLTLDLNMPLMDGLSVLRILQHEYPLPVIMVSALTVEGAEATLDALELGAVDFIGKNITPKSLEIDFFRTELTNKVKWAAKQKSGIQHEVSTSKGDTLTISPLVPGGEQKGRYRIPVIASEAKQSSIEIVVMGASTGGPIALQRIIPLLPCDFPVPIVVAQHIPPQFSQSLAQRLDKKSHLRVKEAEPDDQLEAGTVFVAPGGKHLEANGNQRLNLIVGDRGDLACPSVNRLFMSMAMEYKEKVLGVVLTGMGDDGVIGCQQIRELGGRVLVQDEATSVAYGMPRMVKEQALADREAPLEVIAAEILRMI